MVFRRGEDSPSLAGKKSVRRVRQGAPPKFRRTKSVTRIGADLGEYWIEGEEKEEEKEEEQGEKEGEKEEEEEEEEEEGEKELGEEKSLSYWLQSWVTLKEFWLQRSADTC
jgi:hypothetical protein